MAKIGTLLCCKLHLEREIYLSFEICLVLLLLFYTLHEEKKMGKGSEKLPAYILIIILT